MNKGDLISAVAAGTGLSKADAGRAIDAITSAVAGELSGGGSVSADARYGTTGPATFCS